MIYDEQRISDKIDGGPIFEREMLENIIVGIPYRYRIFTDTYDEKAPTYIFGRFTSNPPNKSFEILLSKTMRDEKEFKQEVENLAKYFNIDPQWS